MATVAQRIVHAEDMASRRLASANEAREKGNTRKAAQFDSAAQQWLDEANRLRKWD